MKKNFIGLSLYKLPCTKRAQFKFPTLSNTNYDSPKQIIIAWAH